MSRYFAECPQHGPYWLVGTDVVPCQCGREPMGPPTEADERPPGIYVDDDGSITELTERGMAVWVGE